MDNKEVGHINVTFESDGNVQFDIQGNVNYMQLYGVAAVLHEQARQEHAKATLAKEMGITPAGLVRAGAMPQALKE